jgi:plastocyanin
MMRFQAAAFALLLAACGGACATPVDAVVLTPSGVPVADAAVVLLPLSPATSKPRGGASIEQRNREFMPYVTVVQTGTAIDFPNNDPIKHHVYSFSPPKQFEIKLYGGKPGKPVVFDKPGVVVIGCNIHDWMEAHVLVVDTPWFGKTAADGKTVIADVPPGRYKLQLWHPQQKTAQPLREIEVGSTPSHLKLALDVRPREHKPRAESDPDHY